MKKVMLKLLKRAIIVAFIVGVIVFGSNIYMVQKTKNRIVTPEKLHERSSVFMADAAIILGAYVQPNGQLSLMLRERIDTGIAIYKDGFVGKLVMSGDHGRADYNEVRAMKDYAISEGIPSEDIFMDHAGFSTYETMYRAKAIFGIERAFIVTQEYHLPRALYDAEAMGIEASGVICDKAVYSGHTYRWVREVLAKSKDFFYCLLKPAPTYLGDVIPISGSGDLTND